MALKSQKVLNLSFKFLAVSRQGLSQDRAAIFQVFLGGPQIPCRPGWNPRTGNPGAVTNATPQFPNSTKQTWGTSAHVPNWHVDGTFPLFSAKSALKGGSTSCIWLMLRGGTSASTRPVHAGCVPSLQCQAASCKRQPGASPIIGWLAGE